MFSRIPDERDEDYRCHPDRFIRIEARRHLLMPKAECEFPAWMTPSLMVDATLSRLIRSGSGGFSAHACFI